ncbi:hypothetical protein GCM10009844_32940 [Nocardioides koreensis]|uniref:Transglycosylase SLT domain-containing protein n=1 Tax=Nocardioides koreensis TaxID=433651 RepID=A0ABP5LP83_9ACTN
MSSPYAAPAAAVVAAACLLVSCSGPAAEDAGGPDAGGRAPGVSAAPSPSGATSATVPSGRPEVLATQLARAAATLRDPDAAAAEQQRAGELQQLAVRGLATGSDRFEDRVTGRLDRPTALVTRASVRASRLLGAMTAPEPRLPRWRIVAPAPPGELLGYFRAAERRTGVPWTYLAAINLVETRMGRIRGTSTAGAHGPMQFIPATWAAYGAGGDVNDPGDAILGAARLLRANGAPGDMAGALWHYNQSRSYVRAVSAYAHSMQVADWAYRGYWHWRVLYSQRRGTYVLPVGYPDRRAVLLPED